jgi:hypothetical protein
MLGPPLPLVRNPAFTVNLVDHPKMINDRPSTMSQNRCGCDEPDNKVLDLIGQRTPEPAH